MKPERIRLLARLAAIRDETAAAEVAKHARESARVATQLKALHAYRRDLEAIASSGRPFTGQMAYSRTVFAEAAGAATREAYGEWTRSEEQREHALLDWQRERHRSNLLDERLQRAERREQRVAERKEEETRPTASGPGMGSAGGQLQPGGHADDAAKR